MVPPFFEDIRDRYFRAVVSFVSFLVITTPGKLLFLQSYDCLSTAEHVFTHLSAISAKDNPHFLQTLSPPLPLATCPLLFAPCALPMLLQI